ncbi:tetratricopeptide repeat protein [Streptomyces sp. NPDC006265]|uniref:tetratricopeptide repeat protein n=1 Tax=Streptomyces sp. NPDC006265 TaxID=3156740 RepID=UPI0033BDD5EF
MFRQFAVDNYQRLVAVCHKVCDRALESVALNALGTELKQLGRYEEAVAAYREAVAIHEERDEERLLITALLNLGIALRTAGRITEAAEVHEREIGLARARGDRHKAAEALERLATTVRCGRRRLDALEARVRAVAIYREQEDTRCEGRVLGDLGLRVREAPRADRTKAGYTWVLANLLPNDVVGQEGRTLIALTVTHARASGARHRRLLVVGEPDQDHVATPGRGREPGSGAVPPHLDAADEDLPLRRPPLPVVHRPAEQVPPTDHLSHAEQLGEGATAVGLLLLY